MDWIQSAQKIIICSGAGVSTNSGIPDYRSASGIFSQLLSSQKYSVQSPEDLFSRDFIHRHPEFYQDEIYQNFRKLIQEASPQSSHHLAKWFHDQGKLFRVITQNVDGLYQKTGLPEEYIIEFHGSLNKDNVVLYGDDIHPGVTESVYQDLQNCDCLIVMGTSLRVKPFCAIPNLIPQNVPRILVDKYPELIFDQSQQYYSRIYFGEKRVSVNLNWTRSHRPQKIVKEDCDIWSEQIMKG